MITTQNARNHIAPRRAKTAGPFASPQANTGNTSFTEDLSPNQYWLGWHASVIPASTRNITRNGTHNHNLFVSGFVASSSVCPFRFLKHHHLLGFRLMMKRIF